MADIVNLRRRRKQKERQEKDAEAEQNRIRFGRRKAERLQAKANDALDAKRLEGHKRDS